MLVVDGPVSADGYDWYEVMEEGDLFGWVARGKDGQDWIEPAEPRCSDDLDASAPWTVDRLDFLVCYGDRPVLVPARSADVMGPDTGPEPPCKWAAVPAPCTPIPRWLFEPFAVVPVGNDEGLLEVAARPAARKQLAAKPSDASMTVTLAMDDPRAPACRLLDDRDRDRVSRDEAVTRCRLRFVITDVGWEPALALPSDHL